MRKINVTRLKPGMELAKPIYANNGVILLRDGTHLTQNYIDKIQFLKLPYIYIVDEASTGIEIEDIISDETKRETSQALAESINMMKKGYFDVNDTIVENVEHVINEVVSNPKVMMSMQEIRNKDEFLLMHSINVTVLSLMIAKRKGYNDTQMKHLAMGALLHDIGKTRIDSIEPTVYREEFTESEMLLYKDHVRLGYELIKKIPNSSLLAANVALTHHEHFDGSGFPLGKKNDSIHEFARIVAVANEYDNLVYNRSEAFKLPHYEVIELIVSKAYSWFDPEIIRVFRSTVSPYPLGSGVKLNDGRIGIVSHLNENLPTRPVIRLLSPHNIGQIIGELDLAKNLSILITEEIDIDAL